MNRILSCTLPFLGAALLLSGGGAPAGRHAPIVDHSIAPGGGSVSASGSAGARGAAAGVTTYPLAEAGRPYDAEQGARARPAAQPNESVAGEKDWRPRVYTVQPGDTLYGIAFNFGLDYHDLAALNNIPDPTVIHAGQVLRLFPAAGAAAAAGAGAARGTGAEPPVVSRPMVVKLPWSDQAVAQVEQLQATLVAPPAGPGGAQAAAAEGGVMVKAGVAEGNIPVKWEMPASGRVIAGFSEADNRKGIDIAGKVGQPVYASAPGKVVYSGTGLRGYGKLVIIKHNDVYLSAYAHNDKLLVREGQMVSQGQMIAQMGSSDADRVALHFEIRKLGRPVDPAKYLVLPKS